MARKLSVSAWRFLNALSASAARLYLAAVASAATFDSNPPSSSGRVAATSRCAARHRSWASAAMSFLSPFAVIAADSVPAVATRRGSSSRAEPEGRVVDVATVGSLGIDES